MEGLEKAKERILEQHLRLRAPQTWVVSCASADQYLRTTVGPCAMQPTPMDVNAVVSTCGVAMAGVAMICQRAGCNNEKCGIFFQGSARIIRHTH